MILAQSHSGSEILASYGLMLERRDFDILALHCNRVIKELEEALSSDPDCGEALTGQFKELFKLHIGDYRVVCSKKQEGVLLLRIKKSLQGV
jgi:mRNA-degrading endonuclease RelE of RelBE toxin-antitoxin system